MVLGLFQEVGLMASRLIWHKQRMSTQVENQTETGMMEGLMRIMYCKDMDNCKYHFEVHLRYPMP